MTLQELFHTIDQLSPDEKRLLLEHLRRQVEPTQPLKERIFDMHPGAIVIHDDDDLPDSFWLDEE